MRAMKEVYVAIAKDEDNRDSLVTMKNEGVLNVLVVPKNMRRRLTEMCENLAIDMGQEIRVVRFVRGEDYKVLPPAEKTRKEMIEALLTLGFED